MSKKPKRITTGISLDGDVVAYLEELGKREDRDRSWLINAIVREHAERSAQGKTMPALKGAPRE